MALNKVKQLVSTLTSCFVFFEVVGSTNQLKLLAPDGGVALRLIIATNRGR